MREVSRLAFMIEHSAAVGILTSGVGQHIQDAGHDDVGVSPF